MKPSEQAGTRVNFKLGQVEQVLLVAIEALKDEACVTKILKWVADNSHLTLREVATFTMLSRLREKGLVNSTEYHYGKTLRRYYTVAQEGKELLEDLFNFQAYLANLHDSINRELK